MPHLIHQHTSSNEVSHKFENSYLLQHYEAI